MNDQSPHSEFKASSFMQGHNAEYLEQLYAQYAHDPEALDATWQEFFKAMGDDEVSIKKDAEGPSWGRRDWPPRVNDDLIAALDGQWVQSEDTQQIVEKISQVAEEKNIEISNDAIQRAVLDSVRALMLIRAYRIRGHLAAALDPLKMRDPSEAKSSLDPKNYGFLETDLDRPIFIDNVLGLQIATMRQIVEIVNRT